MRNKYTLVLVCAVSLLSIQRLGLASECIISQVQKKHGVHTVIGETARKYSVDPCLIHSLVWVESYYNPKARSVAGAQGLTQLMPETAMELGIVGSRVWDPWVNVDGGVRYLISQLRRFGSVRKALEAYHAGPTAVANGKVGKKSRKYAEKVLSRYFRLRRCDPYDLQCLR